MAKRSIKRGDEEFVVALTEDGKEATVTDEKGFTVRISYTRGARPFQVRTPNGWGDWRETMEGAVDYAISLCLEARTFLGPDEFSQRLEDYLKAEDPKD